MLRGGSGDRRATDGTLRPINPKTNAVERIQVP